MTGVRALVVENDPFTLTSLVSALEYRRVSVVGSTTTSRDALELQRQHSPDVALLDLDLGVGPTGIDLAHAMRVRQPELGVVILSSYRDPRLIRPGMLTPPRGALYLSKADITDFSTVVATVLAAARGPLTTRTAVPSALPPLTEAQLEVLRLVAEGLSTQAIAQERQVSVKAVEQMIRRLSEILDLPRDASTNQHVQLARAYLELAGKLSESGP